MTCFMSTSTFQATQCVDRGKEKELESCVNEIAMASTSTEGVVGPDSFISALHKTAMLIIFGLGILIFMFFYFPLGFFSVLLGGLLVAYTYFFGPQPSRTVADATLSQVPAPQQTPALPGPANPVQLVALPHVTPAAAAATAAELAANATAATAAKSVVQTQTGLVTSELATTDATRLSAGSSLDALQAEMATPSAKKGRYLDAEGASPGAKAMAAAMKARAMRRVSKEVMVLYGSQTGNAMEIAKGISAEAVSKGIASKAYAMNDFPLTKLPGVAVAIFVVSSTGDGDPPENCETFYNAIRRKSHAPDMLAGLQYTVLGLGDSNFTMFMHVPKVFSTRLPELGAKCFYKVCMADEVDGLEDIVDQWQANLWEPLQAAVASAVAPVGTKTGSEASPAVAVPVEDEEVKLVGVPALQACGVKLVWLEENRAAEADKTDQSSGAGEGNGHVDAGGSFSAASPLWAPVTDARCMTADWSDRVVVHLEVDIGKTGVTFRPGDSIGILPQNDAAVVDKLLLRLGVDGDRRFRVQALDGGDGVLSHIKQPCSLREALSNHVDVTAVAKKGLLRVLAEYCADTAEKNRLLFLSSRGGKEAYKTEIQDGRPGLLDLLEEFPSCRPDVAHLLDALPPLVARFYSIANSPETNPDRIQVAFSVVRMETAKGRVFRGVATTWLETKLGLSRAQPAKTSPEPCPVKLPIFPKGGGDFHPPMSLDSPMILIGPGTGVAPFRGFLQERRARIQEGEGREVELGEAWLFFGCRREEEDYLYKEDLEGFAKDGTLTRLVVAFSRAQEKKVYVQDKLREHGAAVCRLLLDPRTVVYVCGDGAHMAKDVHAALLAILGEHGDEKESLGVAHMNTMVTEKRYIRDIWS